jgi:hypothetical protein
VIEERLICVEQIDEVVAKEGVNQLSEPFWRIHQGSESTGLVLSWGGDQ